MTAYSEPMKVTSPTLHITILFSIVVFAALLIMTFVFRVEVVARGQGRVIPINRVQVVQPEFAGQIIAINTQNGAPVQAGDVLIELNSIDAIASLGAIRAEQQRLIIEMARIDAMGKALLMDKQVFGVKNLALAAFKVPKNLIEHPFVAEQTALLVAEVDDLVASFTQIVARVEANRRSEAVTGANIDRVNASLDIQSERLATSIKLLEQGATTRTLFLDAQQAFTELEREREIYLREMEQKVAERIALESEQQRLITELRRKLYIRSSEVETRLATLAEEESVARRRVETASLHAPVTGIVDGLSVFTLGGVVEAGTELLRIVPTSGNVEIEGTFSNQDIGFMETGQKVKVRLDAFPSERFGYVTGEVTDIAADSTETAKGQWGYVVHVFPTSPFLEAGGTRFTLRPGMTATIDVITGERRLISYFFAPIVRTLQNAMGER
jgi:hemolysin D